MKDPIAIVGAACQYPDAGSPVELWENILAGRRSFRRLPDCRLRLDDYFSEDAQRPDSTYATHAAVIANYEFDRARFRVVGSTFRSADMAHWLALDVASRAFADAGFPDGQGLPKDEVGVLVGNSLTGEFSRANVMRLRWPYVRRTVDAALVEQGWSAEDRARFLASLEEQYKAPFPPVGDETLAGGLSNTIAGRICNYFDLRGGGYTVDGACASSLLAVANACTALSAGDIDIALAGGVDLSLDPFELIGFAKVGALAKTEMRVYDARSAGFWPGEGCGLVVLMRASDAVAQNRRIYALVCGWGISSDGSGGITRPEVEGQKLALQRAYRRAGFGADSVGFFEGHGTGTTVGDSTELEALLAVRQSANREFGDNPQSAIRNPKSAIGSIKANIGHTKAAAGVAGLLKAMLALHHQTLPPSVGWEQPHSHLTADDCSLRLLRHGEAWPADLPLRAAVSAMGFGGINAHLVLEAATVREGQEADSKISRHASSIQDAEVFLFGGEQLDDVEQQIRRVERYAAQLSFGELSDLAAELVRSLRNGPVRAAVVASRPAELERALRTLLEWIADGVEQRIDADRGIFLGSADKPPSIGYLFPGQGTEASLHGGAWATRFPLVRDRYREAGLPAGGNAVATEVAHPAIITSVLAGLDVLERLGIEATVGVGHSLGELAAYHWAGALDEPAVVRLVRARGLAIAVHGKAGGAMAGIAANGEAVAKLIGDERVVISGFNSPQQTVVSGESAAVEKVVQRAHDTGLHAVRLAVSHAFHSPLVADAVVALSPALEAEQFRPTERIVASTITGGLLDGGEDLRESLRRQLTSPVRLMDAIHAAELKVDLWIEVGPGHVLRGIVSKIVDGPIVSLDAGGDTLKDLLRTVSAAFVLGTPVKVAALFEDRFTRPFNLDWQAKFFVNPCELAPLTAAALATGDSELGNVGPSESPAHGHEPSIRGGSSLEVVRQLVAERAELPLTSVRDGDQLLQDLHFSSIAVGSVVADAARALGLPPPVAPTDYARATVGELAAALDELASSGLTAAAPPEIAPPGVDAWVRNFTVELVEQPLSERSSLDGEGHWNVVAPTEHALASALQSALDAQVSGRGVALCLPPDFDERHLPLLIDAAKCVLDDAAGSRFLLVQHGRGAGGWARTLHLELPQVTTCVVNVPEDHPQALDWIVAEARAAAGYVESHYDTSGVRRVPVLRRLPECPPNDQPPLGTDDVLLVTGGGKGIAAECALALARQYGMRLALLGRSQAGESASTGGSEGDPQLDENLRRFTAAGVKFRYLAVDVTDSAGIRSAVAEIERTLGPISAVLHGAGSNVPQSLRTLDEVAMRRTLAPKIDGLRNVLAAIDPDHVRLLVTFGSIIARTGLHGEADYALANEWLTDLTEDWKRDHPHCRCLAVEWSVWSGVGMGERLGRIDALRRQGITPIGPDEGVRILRKLIAALPHTTAIVVSGRFGNPPTLRLEQPHLPLLRFLEQPRVHVPGVELVVDVTLSLGTDPYLRDHVYQDTPLLPAVVGLEAMAQVTKALVGSLPDTFEDVELSRPITVPESGSRTIRLAALVRAAGHVEVVIRSDETGYQADHFRATCRVESSGFRVQGLDPGLRARETAPVDLDSNSPANGRLALDPRRDLYGSILFHRGRFRRVEGYRELSATRCLADVSPDGEAAWFGGYLPKELLLGDPAMRDAAIHAIQACIPHGTILPIGIDRVELSAAPLHGECFVRAQERERDGDRFVYDLVIGSSDGRNVERWQGLRLKRVAPSTLAADWVEPLLGPYLERRLAELVPGTNAAVSVAADFGFPISGRGLEAIAENPQSEIRKRKSSDRTIAAVLDTPTAIHRRPDGKPIALSEHAVSLSHAGQLTFSIASEHGLVACDAEPVASRDTREWRDLLGSDRDALANLIASQSPDEEFGMAATRIWSAAECLKKAGLPLDTPLVLGATLPDRWIMLEAGRAKIATWIGSVRGRPAPLAVALLVGSDDEVL